MFLGAGLLYSGEWDEKHPRHFHFNSFFIQKSTSKVHNYKTKLYAFCQ